MKYRLKRQNLSKEIAKIISRQYRNKDLDLHQMTRKNFKELKEVLTQIEKHSLPTYLVRKKLPGKIGYGIFLHPKVEPLTKGRLIAPYAGEVTLVPQSRIDQSSYAFDSIDNLRLTKEEQKKFDPKNRYHPRRLYALKLDACKKGNFTRFINHSSRPNLVAYLVSTSSHPYEIIYFAKKKILPGEQLLVSYEEGEANSYWGPLGIKPFPMTPRTFRLDQKLSIKGFKS